jgi:transposase
VDPQLQQAVPPDAGEPPFAALTHFAGFDWATDAHQLAVVDRAGAVLLNLRFADDAAGWQEFRAAVAPFAGSLGVAVETRCGPAVERLLEIGLVVYPVNPKAAERFRDRKAPAGVKSDALDAWCLADALRTDGHGWRHLRPPDPLTAELRLLCRDEIVLIGQRTALVNQLRAALREYYPAALDAFDDWTAQGAWAFVVAFPDPPRRVAAGRKRWERFLHAHKLYRPGTVDRRLEVFARADAFASPSPAVTRAKALLAVTLARQLLTLQAQLDEYRARIQRLFDDHPDHGCFGSLPGAGRKLAPRLLGEMGADRSRFESAEALQSYAGTAPVTRQSGKRSTTAMRRACNKTLRATVHLWADLSRSTCAWAEAYYRRKRDARAWGTRRPCGAWGSGG